MCSFFSVSPAHSAVKSCLICKEFWLSRSSVKHSGKLSYLVTCRHFILISGFVKQSSGEGGNGLDDLRQPRWMPAPSRSFPEAVQPGIVKPPAQFGVWQSLTKTFGKSILI